MQLPPAMRKFRFGSFQQFSNYYIGKTPQRFSEELRLAHAGFLLRNFGGGANFRASRLRLHYWIQ